LHSDGVFVSGDFTVMDGATGTGLAGVCEVDRHGRITQINVTSGGHGYNQDVHIICEQACGADVCSSEPHAETSISTAVHLEHEEAIIEAAGWCRATGTLTLAVHDTISTDADTAVSITLQNQKAPQNSTLVTIMASGSIPIGSHSMEDVGGNGVMKIGRLVTKTTRMCTCPAFEGPGGTCACAVDFSDVDPNAALYLLSAAVQCNSARIIDKITVFGLFTPIVLAENIELPETCMDDCTKYQSVLNSVEVRDSTASQRPDEVKIIATGDPFDSCGAGDALKVAVTLQIGEESDDPPLGPIAP
jgi:hypothetical protein